MRFDSSNVFLIVQDVLVSVACVTAPLFTHQKEARAQARSRHPQTQNCRGSAQPGRQAVLAFDSQFGLKSCHIMATLPELEIDTEAQWGASYS